MQNITPPEAYKIILENNDAVILDVRTAEEFSISKISGAINVPVDEIADKIQTIIDDKEKTILVYCHTGVRSSIATTGIMDMGYKNVSNIIGGIERWENESLPVEK
jgi:rhodanese-related sulfurtransferase